MKSHRDIGETIDEVFTCYDGTISLLRMFLEQKSNSQEIILLACARIDSLANLAFPQGPQKQRFTKFLLSNSAFRNLFKAVSVGDLYFFLGYQIWVLPGTIDKPGRLHAFNPDEDREFMNMLWNSELPITTQEIGRLVKFLLHTLSSQWRVASSQSPKKSAHEDLKRVLSFLTDASRTYRRGAYAKAVENIKPVLENFCLGNLLYKQYRCGAIHEHQVDINSDKFFTQKSPYWQPFYNKHIRTGGFLRVEFPGSFLVETLVDALGNFKKALKGKRTLPAAIFFQVCDPVSETEYLDIDSLPEGKDGKISF